MTSFLYPNDAGCFQEALHAKSIKTYALTHLKLNQTTQKFPQATVYLLYFSSTLMTSMYGHKLFVGNFSATYLKKRPWQNRDSAS